jgi:hypothetical protein
MIEAELLPLAPSERGTAVVSHGQSGNIGGAFAQVADATEFPNVQNALFVGIEARLTQIMLWLVGPLREFARRTELIRKEIPDGAQFCKFISASLVKLAFHFANAFLSSAQENAFVGDGVVYLKELGLSLHDFVREINLDGRKFQAVTLIDRKASDFLNEGVAPL